ncbi:MAG: hypothetical protein M3328_03060 [Chloroflexota bacterium]|nr:hypothetical protein [Chloroflexota bacterium]
MALGVGVMLAVVLGVATTALGETGGNFILGKANSAITPSKLVASIARPTLQLVNKSTETAATALNLSVASGKAPLKVNASAGTATNLSADKLDGKDSSEFASYTRTVVVSPTGTPSENGTALKNALAGITDASETNPYLLKIEPGVYDLGAAPGLVMKPWVDVEGSGEGVTTLTATGGVPWADATVQGASNAELRFLSVKNTGGADKAFAIHSTADPFRLTHVSAAASGGTSYSRAVVIDSGATTLSEVNATASGNTQNLGVFVSGRVTMDQVTVNSSGGSNIGVALQGSGSNAQIRNSRIAVSSGITINNFGSARVGASQLEGGTVSNASANGATIKCVASYNANYDPLGANCT